MKKVLSVILCLCLVLGTFMIGPFTAYASENGTVGLNGYRLFDDSNATEDEAEVLYGYELYDTSAVITGYYGDESEVVIPETIEGKPVKMIDSSAFSGNESVERVVLSSQIYNVSSYSFASCPNLKEVVFPESFETISYCAFINCPKLKSVTIPDTVYDIDSYALGYLYGDDDYVKMDDFTIRGYADTEAQRYAEREGFDFVEIKPAEYTAAVGERITAPKGLSRYSFTPDKDMIVYYHAVGASGAYAKTSSEYRYNRRLMFAAKKGQTCTFDVKTRDRADSESEPYESFDFALEEIPIESAVFGETLSLDYTSPLAFEDASFEKVNDNYYDESRDYPMPIRAIRFTTDSKGWVSYDLVDDGKDRLWGELKTEDFGYVTQYSFGQKSAYLTADRSYFLMVYSSEDKLKGAGDTQYSVTLNKREFKKLTVGSNTITRAPGCGDEYYEFDCPQSGWWIFSAPEGISRSDIKLVYLGGDFGSVGGYYFELNRRVQVTDMFRKMVFKVTANDTDTDRSFDLGIDKYHFPEIKLNETKRVQSGDPAEISEFYEYTTDAPRLVEVNADVTLNNCTGSIIAVGESARSSGKGRIDLENGKNSFRFFAMPGETINLLISSYYYDEEADSSADISITLKDVTDSIESIAPGEADGKTIAPEGRSVFSFTPTEDCLITAQSDYELPIFFYSDCGGSVEIASRESSDSRACIKGKTYYFYCDNNRFGDGTSGTLTLTSSPIPVGDADGDGVISVMDASAIQYSIVRSDTKTDEALLAYADIDKNGVVEIFDATFIQRKIAEIPIPYEIG